MITRLLSFVFLGCFLMVNSAHAAVATYTLSGGKISGTLGGVSFSGADFTITADADPDNFVPGLVFGFPLLSQPGVSTMTIVGFTPFQIINANFGPFLADGSAFFGPGTGYGGFAFQVSATELRGIAAVGPLSSVSSNATVTGPLEASTEFAFTTTAGDLVLTAVSGTGTFSGEFPSSAVPEPTSMAIFGLGALGMAYRARRKLKA
jgi:hypothetical protein